MALVATHIAAVQELYVAYFGRPADTAGLAYWTQVVENNAGDTTLISASFAASVEYTSLFAGLTSAQIVDKIYLNMFNRGTGTPDGREYWVDLLAAGTVAIETIVAEVAGGAQTTDAEAVSNKVSAATAFTNSLDTQAENTGYAGVASLALAKNFIAGITTDATLQAAIAPASLAATVSGVVSAGSQFTLAQSLANLDAGMEAKANFLITADGDADATTKISDADITAKVTAAVAKVDALVEGTFAGASAGVQAALLADQVAANAKAVTVQQAAVNSANVEIAKVAGLSAAVATQTAALAAEKVALTAQTAAKADLEAKKASFSVLNENAVVAVAVDGQVTSNGVKIIELKDGKLVLVANATPAVTEAEYEGVTALLASSIAQEAADVVVVKAGQTVAAAALDVNYLDMNQAEKAALTAVADFMGDAIAEGAIPTRAQFTTHQSILDQTAAVEGATAAQIQAAADFKALVDAYEAIDEQNALVTALDFATAGLTAANLVVATLTKETTALNSAVALEGQMTALNAAIDVAKKAFTDNDLTLPVEAAGPELATGASDIFIAGDTDASITLFGLLGTDSLYIGTEYTLSTAAPKDGNSAVLEAFIVASANGADTSIVLEKTAFGSNAATPEVVTITLTGVAAEDVQVNNGIITIATPTV